jgi:ABC-type lipoprotein export system ATPase subunit
VTLVRLHDVRKSFPDGTEVLDGVSLNVPAGGYVAIEGPSGSGKSTLLNILGLLSPPSSGAYELDGEDVTRLSGDGVARLRHRLVGFVFQNSALLPDRSVLDNVVLPFRYRPGAGLAGARDAARDALDVVGMAHRSNASPRTLSGGEQQRVALARAVVVGAPLLLADEPTGNLDRDNTERLLNLFDTVVAGGTTAMVVTHDPVVAARAAQRYVMTDGRLAPAAA